MSKYHNVKTPIPSGYRIYYDKMEIAGLHHRKEDFIKAFSKRKLTLELEPEPTNKFDPHAIKINAIIKRFLLGNKKLHIGYVPREIAEDISISNIPNPLLLRPVEIWIGDRGGIKFWFDILGKKADYSKFIGEQ